MALPDGNQGYVLDAVPGLQYKLDSGRLALDINAPAEAFEASALDQARGSEAPPNPSPPGFYFNYNLTGTRSDNNGLSYGAFVEAVAFNGWGSLVTNGVMRGDDNQRQLIHTYWQTDLPGSMETLVLGDTIGTGGAWSRPARFGGIRWARNFALRPGYFTFPMPSISGSAALPSTVDVLVNNQRQQSQTVAPGPFAITNVPVVTGAGEVNLVVRDLLGVETLVTQSYYTSPRLLARACRIFPSRPVCCAKTSAARASTMARALPPALGARVLTTLAPAKLAWNYSGSGSLQGEHFDSGYVQFGALPHEIRPRDRFTAGYGMPLRA
ncbi:MAG: fimbria/pilus outer membrane usher protein [Methylobacter sp.]|uniref:fimbria/pilus outer membrane usher protein n=1 Tax=Methylobacter sp. TaxID=2051955 RepID=UPI0025842D57|nr:fimbria/pilus outer membrane usher protein [Methylobacter sp.]MCL7422345.1 fimbria/pilus outer membrane usher protein [Methylobacter sp.]